MVHLGSVRILCSILVSVFVYLSVIPCNDVIASDAETEFHAEDSHDHEEHSDCHDCSPFCVCQCCHTPVVIAEIAFLTLEVINIDEDKFGAYQDNYQNNITYCSWRPPQS